MSKKQTIEDSIQKNKLTIIGKLAATFSHEIRSPLSVLKLNLQYINTYGAGLDDEIRESIESCLDSVSRIQYLTDNILELSRKSNSYREECNVNDLLRRGVLMLSKMALNKKINITEYYNKELPIITIDTNKLLQVFLNLITNAIEASSENSSIDIVTNLAKRDDGACVIIEIEDYGVGIEDSIKNMIFQEFFTNKKKGTGIGLNVCRKIIEEFRGEISFKSEIGRGTKFTISLPYNKELI